MMGYGDFGWMGGGGWLWLVVVCALVMALVIWGMSTGFWSRGGTADATSLEILRRRYAAGEITAAEFEQAKRAIA
jgi:uncharacterized membrane protein